MPRIFAFALAVFFGPLLLAGSPCVDQGGAQGKTAPPGEDGFVPLFNGKDLTGWHNVNCAPNTFYVKDGMIVTTGVPTGYLRTAKQYENFILEFEWFHVPKEKGAVGNSGLFVWGDPIPAVGTGYTRSIEVQVLVNLEWKDKKSGKSTATSQGDLFSIWGAKCKPDRPHPLGWERSIPSENRAKGEMEWNHYRVDANNGVLKLAVNGKVVSGVSESKPRKGYLALESEGSECRFKNLKIKELPSTNPRPEEICDVDKGWKALFTGVDLTNWKATDEQKKQWKMNDGVLTFNSKLKGESILWTDKEFGDFELVFDWLAPTGSASIHVRQEEITGNTDRSGDWSRAIVRYRKKGISLIAKPSFNSKAGVEASMKGVNKYVPTGPIGLVARGKNEEATQTRVQFRNVFIRELKEGE